MQSQSEQEIKIKRTHKFIYAKIASISTLIVLIFVFPFLQVFFPNKSSDVSKAEKTYIKTDDLRLAKDKELKELLFKYNEGKITKKTLITNIENQVPLIECLEYDSKVLLDHYKETKNKEKVFGFRNAKVFVGHLGMPVVAFSIGLFLLFLFFKEEDYFFRKVILAFSFIGIITSLFYIIWIFYPKPDLPESIYVLMLLSFAIIGSLVAFIIGKYFYALSQIDLKLKIQDLLSFITRDIKRKYISKQDRREYINDYLGEIKKLSQK